MFSFRPKHPLTQSTWSDGCVEFDRDFPKECFDETNPESLPVPGIFAYCTGMIHESGQYTFGLDAKDIHIDFLIDREMSIFLEQLDTLLLFLRNESPEVVINFFEQGCTFKFHLSKEGGLVRIHIKGRSVDQTVEISEFEMRRSISRLLLNFLIAVADLTPSILQEPAFEKWFTETLLQFSS